MGLLAHRLAAVVAFATFVLLVIGGTVNPTGSSLACPEPTLVCHGELFPEMVGGVLYEHGHRLAAMTVGLLQIALTIALARGGRWRLGALLLAMVCVQGALGALTVKYLLPWYVSTGHLLLAMTYFAALIYTRHITRPSPSVLALEQRSQRCAELGAARRWIVVLAASVFIQLTIGALVRHLGAALVCLDIPGCGESGELSSRQWLQLVHRGVGVGVALVVIAASLRVWQRASSWPALRVLALLAPVVVVAQIGLGVATVWSMRAVPIAVGHFAGATALWAIAVALVVWSRPVRLPKGRIGRLGS
jgi:cytochrome c oxidase assembly protein subunit 15